MFEHLGTATSEGLHLHAVREPFVLAELPFLDWIGLPVTGTVELDLELLVPRVDGRDDLFATRGTVGIRATERCRIGDDATPIKSPRLDAIMPGGLPFSHIDLDALDVELTVGDGKARLTRFAVTSPDLEAHLDLTVTINRYLLASGIDGVLRAGPLPAFAERDPIVYGLFALLGAARDPSGLATLAFTGTLREPRLVSAR